MCLGHGSTAHRSTELRTFQTNPGLNSGRLAGTDWPASTATRLKGSVRGSEDAQDTILYMRAPGRRGWGSRGPEGASTHQCRVRSRLRRHHGTLCRNPGRARWTTREDPQRSADSLRCPAYTQPCLCAGWAGGLFPRVRAPGPRARSGQRNSDPEEPAAATTSATRTPPEVAPTRDPSPALSLAQSYRLLPQSLLGNVAPAAPPGTSEGNPSAISAADQGALREGPWETTSSGPRARRGLVAS